MALHYEGRRAKKYVAKLNSSSTHQLKRNMEYGFQRSRRINQKRIQKWHTYNGYGATQLWFNILHVWSYWYLHTYISLSSCWSFQRKAMLILATKRTKICDTLRTNTFIITFNFTEKGATFIIKLADQNTCILSKNSANLHLL